MTVRGRASLLRRARVFLSERGHQGLDRIERVIIRGLLIGDQEVALEDRLEEYRGLLQRLLRGQFARKHLVEIESVDAFERRIDRTGRAHDLAITLFKIGELAWQMRIDLDEFGILVERGPREVGELVAERVVQGRLLLGLG